jgi:hypothetical protein
MSRANEAVTMPAEIADEASAEMSDRALAMAKRGDFLPRDPSARAARLEARVRALQRTGLQLTDAHDQLREEVERLRVLLAWEAGALSEGQAAARLGVGPETLRGYRAAALRLAG